MTDRPSPTFPLRLAAIDIGSNAMRLLVAEFAARDRWTRVESVRAPVRLGADAFARGALPPERIDAAVAAVADFRARMELHAVQGVRAAATSAVREAGNGRELLERIEAETGVRVEEITGAEEARLVWLGVHDRLGRPPGRWLLADLGGGSLEVSVVDGGRIEWSESLPLGTLRLLGELRRHAGAEDAAVRMIEDRMQLPGCAAAAREPGIEGMIATGGNAEALADLAAARPRAGGARVLPLRELDEVLERLSRLTPAERQREMGLRPDRADVILPAAVVYARVARLGGVREILVPGVGLKEGLLLDLADEMVDLRPHEDRIAREVREGALALGRRYRFDEAHATHVAGLARSLFEQLAPAHGLDALDRRILLAAALLHDVGQFISYRKHHKHSRYIIQHADLPGLGPRDVELAALVARYHRRAEPRADHPGCETLQGGEWRRMVLLASLLRVADALDRQHAQRVRAVRALDDGRALRLAIEGEGDLLPEVWALESKGGLLGKALEREIEVVQSAA
jgi:exopolyphosphatase / guanosine-5'-triphosphate,3'-diphosphate pyrophosphatase